jgi:hypothetical protein
MAYMTPAKIFTSVVRTVLMSAIGIWLIVVALRAPAAGGQHWISKAPVVSLGFMILSVEAWLWRYRLRRARSGDESAGD